MQKVNVNLLKTCCFTGPRSQNLPWKFNENDDRYFMLRDNTKEKIKLAITLGYEYFLCGMALGFDMMCAEIVIELKNQFPRIKLCAILPCKNQEVRWNEKLQTRYKNLLENCDNIFYVNEEFTENCMLERNKYMVDNSSLVIAYSNSFKGGTKYTVNYALKQGINIFQIKI